MVCVLTVIAAPAIPVSVFSFPVLPYDSLFLLFSARRPFIVSSVSPPWPQRIGGRVPPGSLGICELRSLERARGYILVAAHMFRRTAFSDIIIVCRTLGVYGFVVVVVVVVGPIAGSASISRRGRELIVCT